MRVDTYRCDVCGIQKGETNHWHRACSDANGIMITPWEGDLQYRSILPVHKCDFPRLRPVLHLCSDACVIKKVQAWLSAQKEAA